MYKYHIITCGETIPNKTKEADLGKRFVLSDEDKVTFSTPESLTAKERKVRDKANAELDRKLGIK